MSKRTLFICFFCDVRLKIHTIGEKMKKIFVAMLLSALLLTWFGPLPSALALDRSGDEFNILLGTPLTHPSGEAFHLAHGWLLNLAIDRPAGQFDFRLELDGAPVEENIVERSGSRDGYLFVKVYNFPEGLAAGTHTFTGYWYGPCRSLVEQGSYPGPCANPNEQVLAQVLDLTVEFLP
jgi:hypothetical protein